MNDTVIRATALGKKYLIGHQASNERYVALRDVISRKSKSFARSARDLLRGRQLIQGDEVEEFWALKDVNFEIKRGDVVGIIGRNGAGKSTLLKILSRITEPSAGRVEIKGRVASLLEVGAGFHPELTGRENIYLNGAILGMSRAEIKGKFDEIVAFAEIEKFLDTPVKRYSSGMYVRLAFAVAANLEQEILVVDEVLAVGDAEFQKKCLGKMGEVTAHGRTVLFVSHNMNAINTLCKLGLLLEEGRVALAGDTRSVVSRYLDEGNFEESFVRERPSNSSLYVVGGSVRCEQSLSGAGRDLFVKLSVQSNAAHKATVDLRVKDCFGSGIAFSSLGALDPTSVVRFSEGLNSITLSVDISRLAKGVYRLSVDLTNPNIEYFDRLEDFLGFSITPIVGDGSIRALEQDWGYGSFLLPAILIGKA
jgi:lipopolysaccharide transport system ATP-binding protein